MLATLRDFTGCEVLAVDYPGYGLSSGQPSEGGCYQAADAAFAKLYSNYGYKQESVVVFGRSLGTGVAVDLVARHKVKGLVLVSPFTSTFRVITKVKLVPFDRFDSLAKIGRVTCPLLVVHGDRDAVVPFAMAEEIFASATGASRKEYLRLPGARHNEDLPGAYAEVYCAAVRRITGGR